MKHTTKTLLVTAAVTGLLTGATATTTRAADKGEKPGKAAEGKKLPKVHDCAGKNDCKGLGGCKTAKNDCKFKNDCKGKGGCKVSQADIDKAFGKDKK